MYNYKTVESDELEFVNSRSLVTYGAVDAVHAPLELKAAEGAASLHFEDDLFEAALAALAHAQDVRLPAA